jgi:predicted MPP superfamily phosphohydrolase
VLGSRAFWLEPASLAVVEERIDLDWPAESLRIAVLTDLHVGSPFNGIANLRKVVDLTNAAKPDLICILGDLVIQGVSGGDFVPPEQIAPELGRLKAEFGVFAVLGNHDNWLDHDRVAKALMDNGVRLLEDTAERVMVNLRPLWIAGISDLWTRPHNVMAALAIVPNDGTPIIALTHNPDIFPQLPSRVTLTLAGHK